MVHVIFIYVAYASEICAGTKIRNRILHRREFSNHVATEIFELVMKLIFNY